MTIFSSLRVRNYRLFASGQVVSLTGTWMQRAAQDWLVLNDLHAGGAAVGITTGLQFLPFLIFGLYGGVLADRYSKRRLLIAAQVAMGAQALLLGLLVVSGSARLWEVYTLAFVLGLASAVDSPTRQAFVTEIVGPEQVANAVSLNSATFNSARILGPSLAGLMINTVGTGWVFLVNSVSFAAVITGLVMMRDSELHVGKRTARRRGQLREGLSYVKERPQIWLPIVLVGVVGTFGLNFQITLALMTKYSFHKGAGSYGLLSTALAVGSLLGALASARRGRPRLRLLIGSAIAFGVLEIIAGLMPTYLTFLLLLIPTGVAVLTFTTCANSIVQLSSSAAMRGRVMAIYILVFLGGTPIGAPIIGWLAQVLGPRSSLYLGGIACVVAAAATGLALARSRQVHIEPHLLRRRPHVHVRPVAGPDPDTLDADIDSVRSAS